MSSLAFVSMDSNRFKSSGLPLSGSGGGAVSRRPNYLIASHSIRITKHGYAIDPIELRFAEVSNKLTATQRRQSDQALDSNQLGHKVLTLIRGYWSQPAWPRGRQMTPKQQLQQEQMLQQLFRLSPSESPIDSLITCFRSTSFYPHKSTLGHMSIAPISPPPPPPQVTTFRQLKQQQRRPASSSSSSGLPKDSKRNKRKNSAGASNSASTSTSSTSVSVSQSRLQRSMPDPNQYYMNWIPKNKDLVADLIGELCQKVEQVFIGEPRILNIKSPCLVLGDIHGNLMDLRTYERSLWPKAPSCLTNNYLFLGDYVDRGEYSVECVVYLFAMKLIAPDRFFMLRGNHEIASIQRQYTFNTECETKFGVAGRQLWRSFNRVFNVMPIAAIIDEQIFCAHGGIPRSASDISQLAREIPSPLDNPEIQSPAAWEILWNDPITDSELLAMLEMDSMPVQTFTPSLSMQESSTQLVSQAQTPQRPAAAGVAPASLPSSRDTETGPPTNPPTSIATIKSLTTEPASGSAQPRSFDSALSFYIKPENQQEHQTTTTATTTTSTQAIEKKDQSAIKNSDSKAQQSSQQQNQPQQTPSPSGSSSSSDGLRSIPSDTSSIASNTPAQMLNDGFVGNIKRGTAFLFSDKAIENFLEANKFSHIIRAHEVIPTGFAFHGDGRVLTIFSSSQYCGLNNQAACALVDNERIRILRLDTGQAGE